MRITAKPPFNGFTFVGETLRNVSNRSEQKRFARVLFGSDSNDSAQDRKRFRVPNAPLGLVRLPLIPPGIIPCDQR